MNVQIKHTQAERALIDAGETAGRGPALDWLKERGLPTRRVEAWHYTDLRSRMPDFPPPADKPEAAKASLDRVPRLFDATRLPFINGHYASELTDPLPPCAMVADGVPPVDADELRHDDAIGAINAALAGGGLSLAIKENANIETPIGIVCVGDEPASAVTRHRVTIGAGARVTLVERHVSGDGVALHANMVTDLNVAEGAEANWVIVQEHGDQATHLAQLNITLAARAKLTIMLLNRGGSLVRQEISVDSTGPLSELKIRGVNLVGDESHVDVTTVLAHHARDTVSTEIFRNVVQGSGSGVFQGQINVAQLAQKTDAKMACNSLLLSDAAEFSAKPELEIFADDVQCGHGATVTDIDEDHLFYLRARGIGEKEARDLLVKAFVESIFEELENEAIADALNDRIEDWLDENG